MIKEKETFDDDSREHFLPKQQEIKRGTSYRKMLRGTSFSKIVVLSQDLAEFHFLLYLRPNKEE